MRNLDASIFAKSQIYLNVEFELVLTQIYSCYKLMLKDYLAIGNNENEIRNRLYRDYLKSAKIKASLGLENFIFHPETPEIDENYKESSRTDIMVYNATSYLKNEKAYYVIECKRIDGTKALNEKYVTNGIKRFIEGKYPSYKNVNAMLGFVVKPIDILRNTSTFSELTSYEFISRFKYSYISNHQSVKQDKFTLYHLMLDFSKLIKK